MYRCQRCDAQVAPYTICRRVVTASRPREYPARPAVKDPGGVGWEIVAESVVCPACDEALSAASRGDPPPASG